ncbi:MAG: hypothetical protein KA841_04075 [Chitinophagales bacterium]|nr:hypothetical protein [Chitinophagales bacterium]
MRTTGSKDIYQLIHSMPSEEIGYFKKYAKRLGSVDTKYLQLFEDINNQKVFDEHLLRKKYVSYADMKLYLFDIVLEALVFYYRKQRAELILATEMSAVTMLMERGFHQRASKRLKELKNKYIKIDGFQNLLKVIAAEQTSRSGKTSVDRQMQTWQNDHDEVLHVLQQLADYEAYKLQSRIAKTQFILRNQNSKEYNPTALNLPLLLNRKGALSRKAERVRLTTLVIHYQLQNDFTSAARYAKQFAIVCRKDLTAGNITQHEFLINMHNYVTMCIHNLQLKEGINYLEKYFTIVPGSKNYKPRQLERYFTQKELLLFNGKQWKEALRLYQVWGGEFEKQLPGYSVNTQNNFMASRITVYLANECYEEALAYLHNTNPNLLLRYSERFFLDYFIAHAMLHIALGNVVLLPSILRSAQRSFQKLKPKHRCYSILLKYLRKYANTQQQEVWRALCSELKTFETPDSEFDTKLFGLYPYRLFFERFISQS